MTDTLITNYSLTKHEVLPNLLREKELKTKITGHTVAIVTCDLKKIFRHLFEAFIVA